MPIVKSVSIAQNIKSINFTGDGGMSVTLSNDGEIPLPDVTHSLNLADTSKIIDKETSGMTIRQSIVLGLYQHLLASGAVKGEIEA
jgi:hypothetical protein